MVKAQGIRIVPGVRNPYKCRVCGKLAGADNFCSRCRPDHRRERKSRWGGEFEYYQGKQAQIGKGAYAKSSYGVLNEDYNLLTKWGAK